MDRVEHISRQTKITPHAWNLGQGEVAASLCRSQQLSPMFPSCFIQCGTTGPRCNVASPRHYFGRTEVFLSKVSNVGLRRWQLSLQWNLLFDCSYLKKNLICLLGFFIREFPGKWACLYTLFCVYICACMNLWNGKIWIFPSIEAILGLWFVILYWFFFYACVGLKENCEIMHLNLAWWEEGSNN